MIADDSIRLVAEECDRAAREAAESFALLAFANDDQLAIQAGAGADREVDSLVRR